MNNPVRRLTAMFTRKPTPEEMAKKRRAEELHAQMEAQQADSDNLCEKIRSTLHGPHVARAGNTD